MAKKNVKPMTDKQYVKTKGTKCPYCGSWNIEGADHKVDAGEATQEMSCVACGAEWLDCYVLVGYIPQRTP